MEGSTHQTLRCVENLTPPTVQVIVMSANMGCSHCRQRVSRVIAKTKGLLDYVVDVRNKEVTVRGAMDLKKSPIDSKEKNKLGRVHFSNVMNDGKKPTIFSAVFKDMYSNSCFRTSVKTK